MSRKTSAILVLAIVSIASAQQAAPWTAQWITASNSPQKDATVLHFRKSIQLSAAPQHFYVDVTADNQFLFHVNGQRVGIGPSRGDLAHWRYETYDLGSFLHEGTNVLAATVWHLGTHAAIAQMGDRVGFLLHGHGATGQIANTDETWEVEEEKGVRPLPVQVHGYFAADPGLYLDGATFDWAWDTNSQRSWGKAVPLGRGSLRGETDPPNNWQLVADFLPPMEMRLVPAGRVVRAEGMEPPANFPDQGFTVPAHAKVSILIDNAKLTTGYPAIAASGQGSAIRLTYAEALFDSAAQKGNRNEIAGKHIEGVVDEFAPSGPDPHEFIPFTWRTWRYLQLDIQAADQPVHIASLKTWFTAYPFVEKATFTSDDTSLGSIWETGWRTARLDAHDTYMDTSYWERLQYIGDTRIQALISYTVSGDDRLARQAIQAFNDSRIPDGLTQSRYPSSLVQIIPTFSLLWVDMVYDFWLYRRDRDFARAQLAGTRAVLAWYRDRQRPDGLLGRLPWWPFVDWGKDFESGMPPQNDDGGSSIVTLQYIEALRNAATVETALGDPQLARIYLDTAAQAARAVQSLCWSEEYGLIADDQSHRHYSQHANILAVWLDVISKEKQKDALLKMLSTSDSSFHVTAKLPPMTAATYYFRFYLARALVHAGMGDEYLKLLGPWREMLSMGLTTWAESPEPTRSDSHAWSSHPNFDFLTIVAGIRPETPGFKSVMIEPHLGSLKEVAASLPTPGGTVAVKYHAEQSGVTAQLTLPPGMSGHLLWKNQEIELHEGRQTLTLP